MADAVTGPMYAPGLEVAEWEGPLRAVDVPDIRGALVATWSPNGPLRNYAGLLPDRINPHLELLTAVNAALWYVGADMCALLEHARANLPAVVLDEDLLPDARGLVVFAVPMVGMDNTDPTERVRVHAMTWCATYLAYERDQAALAIHNYFINSRGWPLTLGAVEWRRGETTDAPHGYGITEQAEQSMAEDRRTLAALWLLSAQPGVTQTTRAPIERHAMKRAARAGVVVPASPIRVVRLRAAVEAGDHDAASSRREYHSRWVVGGHWRNQAYGPVHSLRRPQWIAPYIKGPDAAPLVVRETVKAWVR